MLTKHKVWFCLTEQININRYISNLRSNFYEAINYGKSFMCWLETFSLKITQMVRFFFLLLPIVLSLPKSIQCIFFRRNLKSLYLNNTYLPIYASLCVFDCWKKKYLMKLWNFFNWLGINFWEKKLYHFLSHLKIKVS